MRAKRSLQKTIRKELIKKSTINSEARMRHKLERWKLSGFPGRTSSRFLRALELVKARLPPKVGAAVLRTAWNGWCTARRFQKQGKCLFGCPSLMQEDSLEHYACCAVGLRFLRERLQYKDRIDRGHLIVLGVNSGKQSDDTCCRLALWSYVMYKSYNHLRLRSGCDLGADEVLGLMSQYLKDGLGGHEGANKIIRDSWLHR